MPIFAIDILKVGPYEYGWLSSAQSIGAVAAALVISQLPEMRRQGPVFLVSVVVFGLATVWFGVSRTFPLAMLALIVHRRGQFGQHHYPQYHPPAANARLHPRPHDQHQPDLLHGRSAVGGDGSGRCGAAFRRAVCDCERGDWLPGCDCLDGAQMAAV